jgi:hypothetical protein
MRFELNTKLNELQKLASCDTTTLPRNRQV